MRFLTLVSVAIALPVMAQDSGRKIEIRPLTRPDLTAVPERVLEHKIVATERKPVFDVPDQVLKLATPRLWSTPSRSLAANYPPSALTVERVRTATPNACESAYDRVDLSIPRKRGFRLASYSAEPLDPRYGYRVQAPLEAVAVNTHIGDFYTATLDKADQIRIRPPLFVRQDGGNMSCWSGYRLTIVFEGPIGEKPYGYTRPSNR